MRIRTPNRLQLNDVSHAFSDNIVLNEVSFSVSQPSLIGVYGPNGAGKSTLLKIIGGLLTPRSGQVILGRCKLPLGSPSRVRRQGVRYVSQELSLIEEWTVGEQLRYEAKGKNINHTLDLLREFDFEATLDQKIETLSPEEKQLLEIAKSFCENTKLFLVDEPTSGLDERQRQVLYKKLQNAVADGAIVLIVSHDLNRLREYGNSFIEVFDQKVVLRDELPPIDRQPSTNHKDVDSTEVISLTSDNFDRFDIPTKSIIGISGSYAAGAHNLLRQIYGISDSDIEISFGDGSWSPSIRSSRNRTIAFLSRDRQREWGFPNLPIWQNIAARIFAGKGHHFRNERAERNLAIRVMKKAGVRPLFPDMVFDKFSGGNRQKALVASELRKNPMLLLLDEPISGIDLAARSWLQIALREYVMAGGTALIYSQELDDLKIMCDAVFILDELQAMRGLHQ